jgi:ABC-type uncharacterized transport system involved in gliding motility auxiliary subunit
MSPRRYALFMAAALTLMFIAANVLAGAGLRGLRLDLTADRLYSLSDGTKTIVAGLNEPVDLTFYYSAGAGGGYPALRAYADRVRELLRAYAARAHGQVRLREIDPVRFSEAEDAAVAAGMQAARFEEGGEPVYLGIAGANAVDERVAIPYLAPEREAYLEYEVTRLISELQAPRRMNVALITTLPVDSLAAADPQSAASQPLFMAELARAAHIEPLARGFNEIPPDAEELAILQPWPLSTSEAYAVDQFLMRKGRALIVVDPAALSWAPGPGALAPSPAAPSADLNALMAPWGVSVSSDVVLDGQRALEVETEDAAGQPMVARQPLYVSVPKEQLSREDLVTAGLKRALYFGGAGAISWRPTDGVIVTPLARTTKATMRLAAQRALAGAAPQSLMADFTPSGHEETLAVRISGALHSAFGPMTPPELAASWRRPHLPRSTRPAEIILVSDADFLNDSFYVSQQTHAPFVDNGAFALNAIDLLGGSDALVSLRSRAPSMRSLDRIDAMRAGAQEKLAQTQERLRAELADAEKRLAALQGRGQGSGFFSGDLSAALTAGEQREIEHFRLRSASLRAQLRVVERDYRRDLDRLEMWVVAINVAGAPLLVGAIGALVFWRRARRRGRGG